MASLTHLEVESVEIIEVGEGKYSRESEEEIEGEDEPVVGQDEVVEPPLVADWSDEAREGVVTHEAVHAHPEQVGQPAQLGAGGPGRAQAGQSDSGEDDHHREGQPSKHFPSYLKL